MASRVVVWQNVFMASLPRLQVAPAQAPATVGRYELLGTLGSGGMATVYRARDPLLHVTRAVKVLYREAVADSALRTRFLAEARTLSRLIHPNILRVYEVGEDDGRCWFSMDLVEEGSVQSRIEREGPFSALQSLDLVFQVLCALGAAHQAGIVHRDVKPHNILLRGDGTALLGDFGSARRAVQMLTHTGDVIGTIGYMAPEQRNDPRSAGPASDIYGIGAALYALATGRAPLGLFEGQLDAPHLARLHPEVREIIRNATRYRPEHRFPSARHMAVAVARAADRLTGAEGPEAARTRWIARFDLLLETCARFSLPPEDAPRPTAPSGSAAVAPVRTRSPAEERQETPSPAPVPGPNVARTHTPDAKRRGMVETITNAVASWFGGGAAEARNGAVGVWEGRVGGVLPMRLELDAADGDRLVGWAVTTGLRGQVVTRVQGYFARATHSLELEEISDRPDRGRYSGTIRGNALEGSFLPLDPEARTMRFTLTRRSDGPRRSEPE